MVNPQIESMTLPRETQVVVFRSFACTECWPRESPKVVSEALGHSSVAFTMDTYQHVLPTMGEQVAAAIETALGTG